MSSKIQELEQKIPPMQNEPKQAEIDAEAARQLREAAKEREKNK